MAIRNQVIIAGIREGQWTDDKGRTKAWSKCMLLEDIPADKGRGYNGEWYSLEPDCRSVIRDLPGDYSVEFEVIKNYKTGEKSLKVKNVQEIPKKRNVEAV